MPHIRFDVDETGIATIVWDMGGRSENILGPESIAEFAACVAQVLGDNTVRGAIVTSAKLEFIAGADLDWLAGIYARYGDGRSNASLLKELSQAQAVFRRLETGGKPFVAAINGTALGAGFELCLACHRRLVADGASIRLGLPDAKIGLMPGSGGIQRMIRMVGSLEALPSLLQGATYEPREALERRLVDGVVPATELMAAAKGWLRSCSADAAVKAWDKPGFVMPGTDPRGYAGSLAFAAANAQLRKASYNLYPALSAIQTAVYDGIFVAIDTALRIESRHFAKLLLDPISRNMIRTQFASMREASRLASRPANVPHREIVRLGVLGAGLMGSGIAHVSARAGIDVVLLDVTPAAAEHGKARIRAFEERDAARGQTAGKTTGATLDRIATTADYAELAGVDLVIEAVFEDRAIKADVTRKAEVVVAPGTLYASNTSTLPITGLAMVSRDPRNFVGLHFFSPVQRMRLVEVIRGRETGDAALAHALDYVRQIGKTPIVVNDSRGFYTSRVFMTYTYEGIHMLAEGVVPALIENAGRAAGMPVSPLLLCDEVGLDLMHSVALQTKRDIGAAYRATEADRIVGAMVEKFARPGKKCGKGFYDYPQQGRRALWPEVARLVSIAPAQANADELKTRFLTIQALEAARCLEEGVIAKVEDADVGATLGWGFAPWTGGPLSYVDLVGARRFVETCDRLADRHGERFRPTASLRKMASKRSTFYEGVGIAA